MKRAMAPRRPEPSPGIRKQRPAASKVHAMFGKVKSNNERRPKVSIVQMAGQANTKLTRPKPNDAMSAVLSLTPASLNTVEL